MSKRAGIFISMLLGAAALTGCGEPLTGQDEVAKKAVSAQAINTPFMQRLFEPRVIWLFPFQMGWRLKLRAPLP